MAGENDESDTRREIAALAAQYIADAGLDYHSAKQKAALAILGQQRARGVMPDNEQIEMALREHLELFDPDHAERVHELRQVAVDLMAQLAPFEPMVRGAAWKGIATEEAVLHLELFHDNPKEVQHWLLDRRIRFEVDEIDGGRDRADHEALAFDWRGQWVVLSLLPYDALRGALRADSSGTVPRGSRQALLEKIQRESAEP